MNKFGVALTLAASLLVARGTLAGDGCQAPCGPAACGAACGSKTCCSACERNCPCVQKVCKPTCKSECGKEGGAKRACHSLCENLCHLLSCHKKCAPCQTCGCCTEAVKQAAPVPAPGHVVPPPAGYPGPSAPPPAISPSAAATAPAGRSIVNAEPMPDQ